jgi:hypothetical protein
VQRAGKSRSPFRPPRRSRFAILPGRCLQQAPRPCSILNVIALIPTCCQSPLMSPLRLKGGRGGRSLPPHPLAKRPEPGLITRHSMWPQRSAGSLREPSLLWCGEMGFRDLHVSWIAFGPRVPLRCASGVLREQPAPVAEHPGKAACAESSSEPLDVAAAPPGSFPGSGCPRYVS